MGDSGTFKEKDLVKAIYTAWNIEASLYLIKEEQGKINSDTLYIRNKLIFAPWEDNEFNSDLLKEFGYYMRDSEKERDIVEIKTDKIIKYDWSEVKQLV
jgi:hypothetical protein